MSEGTSHGPMKSMAGGCERTFRNLVVGRAGEGCGRRVTGSSDTGGYFPLFESRASEEWWLAGRLRRQAWSHSLGLVFS
jgi:hypothetical protein